MIRFLSFHWLNCITKATSSSDHGNSAGCEERFAMTKAVPLSLLLFAAFSGGMSAAAEKIHATATIAVSKYEPTAYDATGDTKLTMINVEESFSGDIVATGTARFLQAARPDGSASFVGMERVVGTVGGKKGSFILQDVGTVAGNQVNGAWSIVPGSGTGELASIAGDGGFLAKLGEHAMVTLDYTIGK
jgi:hypothetical protein